MEYLGAEIAFWSDGSKFIGEKDLPRSKMPLATYYFVLPLMGKCPVR